MQGDNGMTGRCETVLDALASITSFEELEGFTDTLRKPPVGSIAKAVTDQEWRIIAQRKIDQQLKEAGRK